MIKDGTFILTKGAFRTRHYSSLTALLFLILDHALTFKDEYNHIWRARDGIKVQVLYLTARYLTLSAEIVHYILLHVFLSHAPVRQKVCQAWYFLLIVTCSAQVLILDTVLFLQVRLLSFTGKSFEHSTFNIDLPLVLALYQNDRKIGQAHNNIAKELTTLVADPFDDWAQSYGSRSSPKWP